MRNFCVILIGFLFDKNVFFDHNSLNVEAFKRILGESESRFFIDCDVRDLVNDYRITVIVSPANSFGFMDGGIDKVYMELFPGIQTRVQDRIKQFNITTSLGRSVLPIGSALLVSTRDNKCPFLACVPTMFFPEKISETRNVYWSMLGLLILIECSLSEMKDVVVAIPCFGTGVGKMTPEAAAEQTREAIEQFTKITISQDMRQTIKKTYAYVLKKMACPQPNTYANTEASNLT
jgi:O-acetyl-ADP-ribose deacetylase (regulator of RNase III)